MARNNIFSIRLTSRSLPRRQFAAALLAGLALAAGGQARGADILDGGVSMIPKDAAFVSATLRLEEQLDLLLKSNAVATLRKLPAVIQALEQLEEQKSQPGSPLSMLSTYLELPENQQAVELLRDMVSTDTFLYGEPSCITFLELIQKVQQAQNAANILQMTRGPEHIRIDLENPALNSLDAEEMDDDDDDEDDDDDDDDNSSVNRGQSIVPVARQVLEAEEFELNVESGGEQFAARMVLQALADNADKIVIPDLVWGFKTGKVEAANSQVKRVEVLLKLVTQTNPDLANALSRKKLPSGDVMTFTIDGAMVPWASLLRSQEGIDEDDLEKVRDRLQGIDIVIALGVVGDRVILSIGDSADHLEKLASPAGSQDGLVMTKPFEPLREHKDKRITAITYMSEALARAVAPSAADIEQLADLTDSIADSAGLSEGAAREAREALEKVATGYKKRLPVPGATMGYSYLSTDGYEGYSWDWSKNTILDGSRRLGLLEHAGGAPLASLVMRTKTDPEQFDDLVSWGRMAWTFFQRNMLPKVDADDRERMEHYTERLSPLAERLVSSLRTKLLPALADGQIGFVIDAKSKARRLQRDLPESAEPLPLLEPAVALKLDDPKLFREGMNELFALADDLVDELRGLNPGSVPEGYQVPAPEKSKVEGGTLWSFPLASTGIDEQIQPVIGIGDDAVVFSLVPKQAGRMLSKSRLETGSQLSRFEEPLAAAAALDFAGLIDALQPWVNYGVRVGVLQQQNGFVDRATEIGPDGDTDQTRELLKTTGVILEAMKSLRVAVAETSTRPDATVTHWRNVIRDMPASR